MKSCEIVSLVTAISCGIANCVPEKDLPLIAAILGQTASTLGTIVVNENFIKPGQPTPEIIPPDNADIIDELPPAPR